MNTAIAAHLFRLLPLACISLVLPFYGQSRAGVLFGVTVPLDFPETRVARSALRDYRLGVFASALAMIAAVAVVLWLTPVGSRASSIAPTFALLFELFFTYLLWLHGAKAVQRHAAIVPLERHTELTPSATDLPIFATACSALPLAAAAVWLHLHWNQIPPRFVLHWNASGIADRWGTRTFDGVYGTLLSGAMTVVLLTCGAIFISRANGPQRSGRRRALVPMSALAWVIAGSFSTLGLRPLVHFKPSTMILTGAIYGAAVFALTLWMLQRSGLAPFSKAAEAYDSTPDSKWHAGLIYYNPSDAAVIVPKRFGWGWTFNFARPTAWMFLAAILIFVMAMRGFVK